LSVDTPQQARDKLPANQARGDVDTMTDSVAETDQVSAGPILSSSGNNETRTQGSARRGETNYQWPN